MLEIERSKLVWEFENGKITLDELMSLCYQLGFRKGKSES